MGIVTSGQPLGNSHFHAAMTDRRNTQISSRKRPQQARSTELVAAILEAAIQVLAREGVRRFTTSRVAERAGVSIGSLYQYFPNKAAILFRLQSDEWRQTTELIRSILGDAAQSPHERLRALVHAFIRSECEEADVRAALDDAAPRYRDAPEAREARASGERLFEAFMRESLPHASQQTCALAAETIRTTLGALGKQLSRTPRSPEEIETRAEAVADMFCAYLDRLGATVEPGMEGTAPPPAP